MSPDSDISNEAAALADILNWSAELPAWQRDALRRLCHQPSLDASDKTVLLAICKGGDAWNYLGGLLAAMERHGLRYCPLRRHRCFVWLRRGYSIVMHIMVFPDGSDEMA